MIARDFLGASRVLGLSMRDSVGVVALGVGMALCEAAGVLMMLPALEFIQAKGALPPAALETTRWKLLDAVFDFVGIGVSLGGLLLIAFAAILGRQGMQFAQRTFTSKVRNRLVKSIRSTMFAGVLAADLSTVEKEATGRLVNDFTNESDTAATALLYSLQICVLLGICGVYLASLVALSPAMTILSVGLMGLTAFGVRGLFRRAQAIGAATMLANQDVGGFLVERLKSLRLIRLSGTEAAELAQVDGLLARQAHNKIAADRVVAELTAAIEPIFIGFAFFCLWLGSVHLGLGLETLGIFLVIVLRLVPIGKDLLGARQIVLQTEPSLDCIRDRVRELANDRESDLGRTPFTAVRDKVQFTNVRYAHPSPENAGPALDGVDLTVPAGRTTALVGPSGGGKSTLIDLLPRLRKAQQGQITIDGLDLDEYELASLRQGIAFVPQSAQVFDVSAAEHIRYGRPGASDGEVETAARRANAWDFLSRLPLGMQTRLGEGGTRLSGGQRQRLDLARALARRSAILILDEPTSALDAESERAFQSALDAVCEAGGTTVIIIAHRLASIASAHQIVVLENGRVSDVGTHAELLAKHGWYAQAWTLQSHQPDPSNTLRFTELTH